MNGFHTFNILQVLIINYLCRDEQTEIHRGFENCKKKVFQQLFTFIIFRKYSNDNLIVSLTPPNNLSAVSLTPVNSFSAVSLKPAINFSPVSFTPAEQFIIINIHSRISPRIFEKIQNGPKGILGGLGDTDS